MTKYKIEVRTAKGWRKARQVGLFLLEEAALDYARRHLLAGWFRIVEVKAV